MISGISWIFYGKFRTYCIFGFYYFFFSFSNMSVFIQIQIQLLPENIHEYFFIFVKIHRVHVLACFYKVEESGQTWYRCKQCHKRYKRNTSVYAHVKLQCNKDPQFHCDICSKKFTQKVSLKTHRYNIHNIQP